MRKLRFQIALLALVLTASAANAALVKLTITATTETTTVNSGDPCGTGVLGCDFLPIQLDFVIDTDLAPPDSAAATNVGSYAYFIKQAHTTTFLTGSATLNGRQFVSIPPLDNVSVQAFPFRQIVTLRDNLPNGLGGLLDDLFIQLDGAGNAANDPALPAEFRFNVNTTFEMAGNEVSGVGLAQLAGIGVPQPPALPLVYGGRFRFTDASGDVVGGFLIDGVSLSAVPEPSVAGLLAAAGFGLVTLRRRAKG